MSWIRFLYEGVKNFKEIGAVARSGKSMRRKMTAYIQPEDRYIVELGAGDGVITKDILQQMSTDAKLLSFEINEEFCKKLHAINDDRLIVINDSAENIEMYMKQHNFHTIDIAISAIPFLVLPLDTVQKILHACKNNMREGALYLQVHYGKNLSKLYIEIFGNLSIEFILSNIPPSYIFKCVINKSKNHDTTHRI